MNQTRKFLSRQPFWQQLPTDITPYLGSVLVMSSSKTTAPRRWTAQEDQLLSEQVRSYSGKLFSSESSPHKQFVADKPAQELLTGSL